MRCNVPLKELTKVNTGIGVGIKIHKFVDANGKDVFLPCVSYYLSTTYVRLFSPQTYDHLHGAHSIIKVFNVQVVMKNHNLIIPINRQEANLCIIYNFYLTSAQNKCHGTLLILGMVFIILGYLGLFGYLISYIYISGTEGQVMLLKF